MKIQKFSKIFSDKEMNNYNGNYFDESHYKYIIDEDCDGYSEDGKLLFKIRKGVISDDLCQLAVNCFEDSAQKLHENRGAAAGLLDRRKLRDYVGELIETNEFRSGYISNVSGLKSNQKISNLSPSNIAGYFDKPDRNLKNKGPRCRLTAFTKKNLEKWNNVIPYIQRVDKLFAELIPDRYNNQLKQALKTPEFIIENTCFSTVTMNYSWRTACHRDSGDFKDGFGNILVCENKDNPFKFKGCYLGFPQYGVCINVRHGDFCATNVHEWHCNTQFIPDFNQSDIDNIKITKKLNKDKLLQLKNKWYYNRLSMVFYLREKMVNCAEK
tara:strand:- start:760 stop:1737 length:978 start_codon:yes stop_codon:yes gene_type:complete